MAAPGISVIPDSAALAAQMDLLNQAIAALNTGSVVTNITVSAPAAPPDDPTRFMMPVSVTIDPPINNPATIAALIIGLQAQSQALCDRLVTMGYVDDSDDITARSIPTPPGTPPAPPGMPIMPPRYAAPYPSVTSGA
jgi:hypothetical protein